MKKLVLEVVTKSRIFSKSQLLENYAKLLVKSTILNFRQLFV